MESRQPIHYYSLYSISLPLENTIRYKPNQIYGRMTQEAPSFFFRDLSICAVGSTQQSCCRLRKASFEQEPAVTQMDHLPISQVGSIIYSKL